METKTNRFLILAFCFACFACETKLEVKKNTPVPSVSSRSMFSAAYAQTSQLPTCDDSVEHQLVYIQETEKFMVCRSSAWADISIKGAAGDAGAQGLIGPKGEQGAKGSDGAGLWNASGPGINYLAGKVGIGTATPAWNLHLYDESDVVVIIESNMSSGDGMLQIKAAPYSNNRAYVNYLLVGGTSWSAGILKGNAPTSSSFSISGTGNQKADSQFLITSTGDIGIGTYAPASKLQVNGYIQLDLSTGSAPPGADCDEASEYGRMVYDDAGDNLYLCGQTGWLVH